MPFLQSETVEKAKICSMEELADYYSLSQCFPGLVAGNVSMFVGYKARGTAGAFAAIVGICLPAFLAIALIFNFLGTVSHLPLVQNIFNVLDIAVCVLILLTIIELWGISLCDKFSVLIFVLAITASVIFNLSPFIIVITAGLLGLFKNLILCKEDKDVE